MATRDTGRLKGLGSLQLLRVQDEDGNRLGHVFDVRTEYDPGRGDRMPVVTEIVYGTVGFLERIGVRRTHPRTIAWKNVVEVTPHAIVVRRKVKA